MTTPKISSADFLKVHELRGPNIMWFLGAGASATAGIATANQMTWQFKRTIYCSSQRISVRQCDPLSDPIIQHRLQEHFSANTAYPHLGDPDEYAAYFELAYPSERDRREFIDRAVTTGKPSRGHVALAALMKLQKAKIIWTTNFDRLVEDSAVGMFGSTGALTVASLDSANIALDALNSGRRPLLVKLHGDFQSNRLMNTPEELKEQDHRMRKALIESCKRYGLAVVGYSGRDQSIMQALTEAASNEESFPNGLYWLHHGSEEPPQAVADLIKTARENGSEAAIVDVSTFDELMDDTLLLVPSIPDDITAKLRSMRPRVTDAPMFTSKGGWPVIRLNALPISTYPTTVRRIGCSIGGAREVRDAISAAKVPCIGTRKRVGVLAFGADADLKRVFEPFGISDWDIQAIHTSRLTFDSAELGLLYDALGLALARHLPIIVERRGRRLTMIPKSGEESNPAFVPLARVVKGAIQGAIPRIGLHWSEACRIALEFRFDRLWLLMEPSVVFNRANTEEDRFTAGDFVRERTAQRYNLVTNQLIDAWRSIILGTADEREFRAFGNADGVDAVFLIGGRTAFSRRGAIQ